MYGYIYKITNNINGKIYIGRTTKDILIRFNEHCLAACRSTTDVHNLLVIQQAIRKYGKENFTIELVFACETFEEYEIKEQEFIEYYSSRNPCIGYNIHVGGTGGDTVTALPPDRYAERSEKISHAISGQHMFNDDVNEFWVKSSDIEQYRAQGFAEGKVDSKPLSEEHKRHISEGLKGHVGAWKGKKQPRELVEKRAKKLRGSHLSAETRSKISATKTGTKMSEEFRKKMSEQRKGVSKSEQHRKNIGLAHKGRQKTEEHKKKISQTIQGSKWLNNGVIQVQAKSHEIEKFLKEGFSYGMLARKKH